MMSLLAGVLGEGDTSRAEKTPLINTVAKLSPITSDPKAGILSI
jgi:hypothetical protein